jgi:hypothetical protein
MRIRTLNLSKNKSYSLGSAGKLDFVQINEQHHMRLELLVNILGRYIKRRRAKFINLEISRKVNKKFRSFFKGI